MKKSEFYTLVGYRRQNHPMLTEAMEDYLEMMMRMKESGTEITVKQLADKLNVQPSSVSKMINRMSKDTFVDREKYGQIELTKDGLELGRYLLWRHFILERFLKMLNQDDYKLEQVEKLEHFIDDITLENLNRLLNHLKQEKNT